jgi:hypothetical protein
MPRNLSSPLIQAISANDVMPCLLADITFASGTVYVWSGVGTVTYNGNTYLGVGSLGAVGDIREGVDLEAEGTTLTLSGIDPTMLNDCMSDIRVGAPCRIYLGAIVNGSIVGTCVVFDGTVDKPQVVPAGSSIGIVLNIETRMTDMQRASNRRYTAADQQYYYPGDTGFNWVEIINDIALKFGS